MAVVVGKVAVINNRVPAIVASLDPRCREAAKKGAEIIARDAASRAPDAPPHGTGLAEAIHTEEDEDGIWVVAGDEQVFWGHYVEYGTVYQAAQPFLNPAADANREKVIALVAASLKGL